MVQLFYSDRNRTTTTSKATDTSDLSASADEKKGQKPLPTPEPPKLDFTYVSDELNNISRDLHVPYNPSLPITDQQGDIRTRVPRTFDNLYHAIWENALSRVFLGVHWIYDACDSEGIVVKKEVTNENGDKVKVSETETDGSTKYKPITGTKAQFFGPGGTSVGGVPLGLGIAEDIFNSGLKFSPVQPS
jgi:vanadium chloroperoxidase